MKYSEEQQRIIDSCKNKSNLIVDAVAGSGKTTTLLGIAEACPTDLILAILYNRSLKEETRQKALDQGLQCLEVHNYHALARKYYNSDTINDNGILRVLSQNSPPIKQLPKWTRIIIDEVQDMTPKFYNFISKVIADLNNPNLRITVMGDRFQSIYAYQSADARYLTLMDRLFVGISGEWVNAKLSTSYRCSASICSFINNCLLGYERMIPANQGLSSPVKYVYGSPFDAHHMIIPMINDYFAKGYKPEDIFILSKSVKVKGRVTPLRILENSLVKEEIPVHVSNDEEVDTNSSNNPMAGKVVITTFHKSKGLEREIVIVYNFDDSYYMGNDEDDDISSLASPLYVGLTRAKKYLCVIHSSKSAPLSYFKHPPPNTNYLKFISTKGNTMSKLPDTIAPERQQTHSRIFTVTELTDYVVSEVLVQARDLLTIETIEEAQEKIPMTSFFTTGPNSSESVSDLNGIAIPALYEWRSKNSMRIMNLEEETFRQENSTKFQERYNILKQQEEEPTMSTVLEVANIFSAIYSGYHYKVAQIKSYNWLNTEDVEPCMNILERHLGTSDTQYEVNLPEQILNGTTYTIRGRVDAYSEKKKRLWEIKCTDSLDYAHEIQLMVYAWIFCKTYPSKFKEIEFHLLNIRTSECLRISASEDKLNELVHMLIAEKTRSKLNYTDDEFIEQFRKNFDFTKPTQIFINKMFKPVETVAKVAHPIMLVEEEDAPKPKRQLTIPMMVKQPNIIETKAPDGSTAEARAVTTVGPTATATAVAQEAEDGKVIIFDLETCGLPETKGLTFGVYPTPSDISKYNNARIVQWSWSLHENDGSSVLDEDYIIKPNFDEFRITNSEIHGITEQKARVQGKPFDEILQKFMTQVGSATTIVAHNVNVDKNVLLSEPYRRSKNTEIEILNTKIWKCTMERGKVLCGLRASNKLKPPKLKELMHALGIKEEAGRPFHNSKHDVYYTSKCYFAEQVLRNKTPMMYEGKHTGKTYEEILKEDRMYAVLAHAACNVHKLYNSPIRKLSNWVKTQIPSDPALLEEVKKKEEEIRNGLPILV